MFYYAQLDENNMCIAISALSGEVDYPNMIPIESAADDYLFKKYEEGSFIYVDRTDNVAEKKTVEMQLSELQEQNLVLMDALATIFEAITGGQ
jgi:hypothetical protein